MEDVYGGSDVVDVMFEPKGDSEAKFVGRREVLYTSNDAFDHVVVTGGKSAEAFKKEGIHTRPCMTTISEPPQMHGRAYMDRPQSITPTQKQDEVDDEKILHTAMV